MQSSSTRNPDFHFTLHQTLSKWSCAAECDRKSIFSRRLQSLLMFCLVVEHLTASSEDIDCPISVALIKMHTNFFLFHLLDLDCLLKWQLQLKTVAKTALDEHLIVERELLGSMPGIPYWKDKWTEFDGAKNGTVRGVFNLDLDWLENCLFKLKTYLKKLRICEYSAMVEHTTTDRDRLVANS